MLEALKFVQGSVSRKDLLPYLTHFAIENGTVRGFNGTIALCSPLPFDITCKPKAGPMVAAIERCNEAIQLGLTATGRLSIKSGNFKAFIECIQDETAHVLPEGKMLDFNCPDFIKVLKTLISFVGDDASRPWTNGVLVKDGSLFATNNVCVIQYWLGVQLPLFNIPRLAVKELIRVGELPVKLQLSETSVTFHYANGCWLRTQLLDTGWPDLGKILDVPCNATAIDERIFSAVQDIKAFTDETGRIYFKDGVVSTTLNADDGAAFDIEGLQFEAIFNADMLMLLKNVATHVDFTTYPKPAIFYGNNIRGAIVGLLA